MLNTFSSYNKVQKSSPQEHNKNITSEMMLIMKYQTLLTYNKEGSRKGNANEE